MKSTNNKGFVWGAVALAVALAIPCVGCQVTRNGQTLPSPHYLNDDIQYHPSGNEFQYQEEVDQMNKINAERQAMNAQY